MQARLVGYNDECQAFPPDVQAFAGVNPVKIRMTLALLTLTGLATMTAAFAPAPVYREPPKPKRMELAAALEGTWEVAQHLNNPKQFC